PSVHLPNVGCLGTLQKLDDHLGRQLRRLEQVCVTDALHTYSSALGIASARPGYRSPDRGGHDVFAADGDQRRRTYPYGIGTQVGGDNGVADCTQKASMMQFCSTSRRIDSTVSAPLSWSRNAREQA